MNHDRDPVATDSLIERQHFVSVNGHVTVRGDEGNTLEPQNLHRSFQLVHGLSSLMDRDMRAGNKLTRVLPLNFGVTVVNRPARFQAIRNPGTDAQKGPVDPASF